MQANDITLDTDKLFSRITTGRNSGTWSRSAAPLDAPETIFISHETAKNGRVNSVVQMSKVDTVSPAESCGTIPSISNIKGQFKISYNPTEGFTDLEVGLDGIRLKLTELVNDTNFWDKMKNKEA